MSGVPADGYIRFEVVWSHGPAPAHAGLAGLDALRTRLHDLGLVGALPDGVGFGNLSLRRGAGDEFIITGSGTGGKRELGPAGYTRVTALDIDANRVACTGPVRASAETMSHGAIYRANTAVRCVVHVHHRALWRTGLAAGWPATPPEAEYGTPAMAHALHALAARRPDASSGLIVMSGHEDGLIAYGPDLAVPETLLRRALAGVHDAGAPARSTLLSAGTWELNAAALIGDHRDNHAEIPSTPSVADSPDGTPGRAGPRPRRG